MREGGEVRKGKSALCDSLYKVGSVLCNMLDSTVAVTATQSLLESIEYEKSRRVWNLNGRARLMFDFECSCYKSLHSSHCVDKLASEISCTSQHLFTCELAHMTMHIYFIYSI